MWPARTGRSCQRGYTLTCPDQLFAGIRLLECGISVCQVRQTKFHLAEIARLAREKLSRTFGVDFPAARVVVIGDTEHDVACARANGYRAVAVEFGWVPREDLEEAGPDALFEDLSDVPTVMHALGVESP